jgi:uracil-DNA glycosylase
VQRKLATSAADFLPTGRPTLPQLARAARGCKGCPLYRDATQTVFGEGPPRAAIMLVGEQPGNEEDRQGHPFVGPAGGVLRKALAEAGVPRESVYLTNAVKHFKFEQVGPRRIHQRPRGLEVAACKPWLMAEIQQVRPRILVALGATAAAALYGPTVRLTRDRGRPLDSPLAPLCLVTFHPSAALRASNTPAAAEIRAALVQDLRQAAIGLETSTAAAHVGV